MRKLLFISLALLAVIGFSVGYNRIQAKHTQALAISNSINFNMYDILNTINKERTDAGLPALLENAKLDDAAYAHAFDMQAHHYYSHTTPDGESGYTRIQNALGQVVPVGENEDNVCFDITAAKEFTRFTTSPEHNSNQMNTNFTVFGVGYVPSTTSSCNGYLVVEFAKV